MRAALKGDERAYRSLLDQVAGKLRSRIRSALSRTGHGNADIEDVVQETLLAIHVKRDTWDSNLPFAPWVNAIAHYKTVDALRRRGFRTHVAIDDLQEFLPAPPSGNTDLQDAERLIGYLGERQQKIVRAISINGQTPAEVASEMAMTEGAVRVALHRALKELAGIYRRSKGEN